MKARLAVFLITGLLSWGCSNDYSRKYPAASTNPKPPSGPSGMPELIISSTYSQGFTASWSDTNPDNLYRFYISTNKLNPVGNDAFDGTMILGWSTDREIDLTHLLPNTSYNVAFVRKTADGTTTQSDVYGTTTFYKVIYSVSVASGNLAGIAGADTLCSDSKPPDVKDTVLVKALLADGTQRVACTTANCGGGIGEQVDWVFAADMTYSTHDQTTILGETSSNRLLNFPLDSPLVNYSKKSFTGLNYDWTLDSANNCNGWTDPVGNGHSGQHNTHTSQFIDGSNESCNAPSNIYCVEQME